MGLMMRARPRPGRHAVSPQVCVSPVAVEADHCLRSQLQKTEDEVQTGQRVDVSKMFTRRCPMRVCTQSQCMCSRPRSFVIIPDAAFS